MRNKDFDAEYEMHLSYRCPIGISVEPKVVNCFKALHGYGKEPGDKKCRRCWREYIELQDKQEDYDQPELFEEVSDEKATAQKT